MTHQERIKAYQRAMDEWNAAAAARTAEIRKRLNDPTWQPRTILALGIGSPPTHPGVPLDGAPDVVVTGPARE